MSDNLTPGMKQYMQVKEKYPDCIVLFRMGDFYETFYQDAKTVSRELDITLTSRGKDEKKAPLAGMPYHAAAPYIAKLVKKGYKVCIVEQVEDPKKAKGLVKRDVVRVITPGTLIDEIMLSDNNNYIMAINKEKSQIAIAVSDISTGEFQVMQISQDKLENELNRFHPSEIILPLSLEHSDFAKTLSSYFVNYYDDLHFFEDRVIKILNSQFSSLPSLTLLQQSSAGALISYIKETQKSTLNHINKITLFHTEDYMILDKVSISNLNIIDEKTSLLKCLDNTKTSMGSRLLKQWMLKPLTDITKINGRLDAVQELTNNLIVKDEIADVLNNIQDLDRLISRVSFKNATPKDLVALRSTLKELPKLNGIKKESKLLSEKIDTFDVLIDFLEKSIKEQPNTLLREGNIIQKGYNAELDELRSIKTDSRQWLVSFEEQEKSRTGIKFLKVRYNKIFGYFIEISNSQLSLVPENYIRKQTQVNCERYITNELKEKENLILNADDKIKEIEFTLFMEILEKVSEHIKNLQKASIQIAIIDVIQSFATSALLYRYARPELIDSNELIITNGRHPVVEQIEDNFISNNLSLNNDKLMMIITGPNMAGKSVYIKQNALIIIMAQIGCFVSAEKAKIGIVDRIFSRVGASDDIASGHSTFMVEMSETANILTNATSKSFIILDEIGRGTSTYDGVSLAWAIAEYIITKIKAKTLFATHYHHLNRMVEKYHQISNYNIAISEKEDSIIFLRKIIEGGTDKSYGIHVAKLAGLPSEVIESSKRIITQLEMEDEIGEMIHKNLKNDKSVLSENMKNNLQKTLLDL